MHCLVRKSSLVGRFMKPAPGALFGKVMASPLTASSLGRWGVDTTDPTLMQRIADEFNRSLRFSPTDTRMAFTVRDPVGAGQRGSHRGSRQNDNDIMIFSRVTFVILCRCSHVATCHLFGFVLVILYKRRSVRKGVSSEPGDTVTLEKTALQNTSMSSFPCRHDIYF